ncbi:MAG: methyltransferase domain-containing protein [Daejeonella sp.]
MKSTTPYDKSFYSIQSKSSYNSAREVVPLILNLIQPNSIVDIGCGLGTWLKAFDELGVTDYIGVDGDYVKKDDLYIESSKFRINDISTTFELNRVFDLAISLEVGEHISEENSDVFVENICRHSKVVLFSAAIKFQGGTNHVNEQMQNYWVEKFMKLGYKASDVIRNKIWLNTIIQPHYRQNIILFIHESVIDKFQNKILEINGLDFCTSVVHPEVFMDKVDYKKQAVRNQFSFFLKVLSYRIFKK